VITEDEGRTLTLIIYDNLYCHYVYMEFWRKHVSIFFTIL